MDFSPHLWTIQPKPHGNAPQILWPRVFLFLTKKIVCRIWAQVHQRYGTQKLLKKLTLPRLIPSFFEFQSPSMDHTTRAMCQYSPDFMAQGFLVFKKKKLYVESGLRYSEDMAPKMLKQFTFSRLIPSFFGFQPTSMDHTTHTTY